MLLRNLRRAILQFSKEKETPKTAVASNPEEYLVFPTKFPIFPYYVYMTKINRYLYSYINRNNIKYGVAFALQPGVAKKAFQPMSTSHLEEECMNYSI